MVGLDINDLSPHFTQDLLRFFTQTAYPTQRQLKAKLPSASAITSQTYNKYVTNCYPRVLAVIGLKYKNSKNKKYKIEAPQSTYK